MNPLMTTTSQADMKPASGYEIEDQRREQKGMSLRSRLAVLSMVLTLVFVALPGISGVGVRDVEASHGTNMTIRGTISNVRECLPSGCRPFATLMRWNGSSWVKISTVGTDQYGNFALVASRGHDYYVYYGYYWTYGYCYFFNGNTNSFRLTSNTSNPFRLGTLPVYYWGRIC